MKLIASKDQLHTWYVTERRSTREVAFLLGISQPWARKILREHGIPIRSYKENPNPNRGKKLSRLHRNKIAKALKGNSNWMDESGKHHNFKKLTVECSQCGAEILKRKCDVKNYDRSFCSPKCHGEFKSKQVGPLSPKWSSIQVKCVECGKELVRPPSQAKNKDRVFCSKECHADWRSKHQTGPSRYNWEGGYEPYYGQSWPSAKRLARRRDNFSCQRCGKTTKELNRSMDVHHKIPFRRFGVDRHKEANDLSNLICYCASCHKLIEEQEKRKAIQCCQQNSITSLSRPSRTGRDTTKPRPTLPLITR